MFIFIRKKIIIRPYLMLKLEFHEKLNSLEKYLSKMNYSSNKDDLMEQY